MGGVSCFKRLLEMKKTERKIITTSDKGGRVAKIPTAWGLPGGGVQGFFCKDHGHTSIRHPEPWLREDQRRKGRGKPLSNRTSGTKKPINEKGGAQHCYSRKVWLYSRHRNNKSGKMRTHHASVQTTEGKNGGRGVGEVESHCVVGVAGGKGRRWWIHLS